jgi:hypothetical protein
VLVPQLTGDAGLMRRFSLTGWGSGGAALPSISSEPGRASGEFTSNAKGEVERTQVENAVRRKSHNQSSLRLLGVFGAVGGLHLGVKELYLARELGRRKHPNQPSGMQMPSRARNSVQIPNS